MEASPDPTHDFLLYERKHAKVVSACLAYENGGWWTRRQLIDYRHPLPDIHGRNKAHLRAYWWITTNIDETNRQALPFRYARELC